MNSKKSCVCKSIILGKVKTQPEICWYVIWFLRKDSFFNRHSGTKILLMDFSNMSSINPSWAWEECGKISTLKSNVSYSQRGGGRRSLYAAVHTFLNAFTPSRLTSTQNRFWDKGSKTLSKKSAGFMSSRLREKSFLTVARSSNALLASFEGFDVDPFFPNPRREELMAVFIWIKEKKSQNRASVRIGVRNWTWMKWLKLPLDNTAACLFAVRVSLEDLLFFWLGSSSSASSSSSLLLLPGEELCEDWENSAGENSAGEARI